jgi:hypothetical protein
MTTPEEFLRFAKTMGFDQTDLSTANGKTNRHSTMGLAVLNNLCRLVEQIHQLKEENHRLRAQVAIVQPFDPASIKMSYDERPEKKKATVSRGSIRGHERPSSLSPSNSLKLKTHQLKGQWSFSVAMIDSIF